MKKPYIGITDFTQYSQVERMLAVMNEVFQGKIPRDLMVGMMMSYKTLKGIPSKWSDVFPKKEQFDDVYQKRQDGVLNTLHYADYDNITSAKDLALAIMIATHRGFGPHGTLDALQLDMIWPSPMLLRSSISYADDDMCESTKYEEEVSSTLKVVLQVGSKAMELLGNDPERVADKIAEYNKDIHCVLFDRSGGLGKPMDPDLLYRYIDETKKVSRNMSIAVAGGLGPDTMVNLMKDLGRDFPDISIDAQARLRKTGSALDPVDWDLAENYIRKAALVLL